jgi:hypothetical protein
MWSRSERREWSPLNQLFFYGPTVNSQAITTYLDHAELSITYMDKILRPGHYPQGGITVLASIRQG